MPLRWPDFQPDLDDLRRRGRPTAPGSSSSTTRTIQPVPCSAPMCCEVIVRLAERHDAVIVTDEVYEHLVLTEPHIPVATLPGACGAYADDLVGGGKTFNTTGWKIGWIHGPADLITAVLTVKQFLTYVNGAPFQPAIAAGLRLAGLRTSADIACGLCAAKRDILAAGLRAAGFDRVAARRGPTSPWPTPARSDGADAACLLPRAPRARRGRRHSADRLRSMPARPAPTTPALVRFAACKRVDGAGGGSVAARPPPAACQRGRRSRARAAPRR